MLNLYYGRSDTDRMKFMYEKIAQYRADGGKSVLVIVPDQYTLEAEKAALKMLNTKGLMDVEIMSFSRMAAKLVGDASGKKYIDDLGRSMILRKVISQNKDELTVFNAAAGKTEFVKMMGDMIQEFKQYKTQPEFVQQIAEDNYEKYSGSMLMKKLGDAGRIYAAYESEIEGKYYDTEDYLSELCEKIAQKDVFSQTLVWIDGFEFFSKRLLSVIENLTQKSKEICISLLYSEPDCRDYGIFAPIKKTLREIAEIGERCKVEVKFNKIPEKYTRTLSEDVSHLNKNLFAYPFEKYHEQTEGIFLWRCENREAEVERIAEEIIRLVSEEGYRFKDIAVAAGDLPERRSLIGGIFSKAGIKYFDGSKSAAVYNKYMQFILAICRQDSIFSSNESIFRVLDAGVFDISADEAELLQNYVVKYNIEGSLWKKDFYKMDKRGKSDEEVEVELGVLNDIRSKFVETADLLYKSLDGCKTGRDFAERFFAYLKDALRMDEKIRMDAERLKIGQKQDYGGITTQLWNSMTSILGQMQNILEEYSCSRMEFFEILRTGIESLELSLIPTTIDQVFIGDFDMVRMNRPRALIIPGFNDGIVPASGFETGILSENEKKKLNEIAGELCVPFGSRLEQEKLSIYQALSVPDKKLIISSFAAGEDGQEMNPSQLLIKIKKIFPHLSEEKVELRSVSEDKSFMPEFFDAGRAFSNKEAYISQDSFLAMYGQNPKMSPTSLEAYARCPFAHFMKYGIRADERNVFEISAPEMGTVFHEVLMRFSQKASDEKLWSVMNRERCEEIISGLAETVAGEHKGGFMFEGPIGEYRISRIKSVCEKTASMVAEHVNRGLFSRFYFEIPFGVGKEMPPIRLETTNGKTVFLEGRIDRIDLAPMEDGTLIKVIDYKSGNDKVVKQEIVSGYKLQLMLYMEAAAEGMKKQYKEIVPAGVFYFKIQEPSADGNGSDPQDAAAFADFVDKNFRKSYKMDGIVVNEPKVIEAIDEDFSGFSEIIRVRKLKNGTTKGTGDFAAVNKGEFQELLDNTHEKALEFCESFTNGNVCIQPMRIDDDTKACTWCKFKSVCSFDTRIRGFEYKNHFAGKKK